MPPELTTAFQALSNPHRLALMERLLRQALTCSEADRPADCAMDPTCCQFGDLAAELDLSKGSVSRHLKELDRAGLIERIREGRCVYVRANIERTDELRAFLDARTHQPDESSIS